MGIFKKRVNEFPTDYTCMKAVREGGVETRLSMLLMGFGNIVHKQFLKAFCSWRQRRPTWFLWQ